MKALLILSFLVVGALAKDKIKDRTNIVHTDLTTGDSGVLHFGEIALGKITTRLNGLNLDQSQKHVADDILGNADRSLKTCASDYKDHQIDHRYRQCVGMLLGKVMQQINSFYRFGYDRSNLNKNVLGGEDVLNRRWGEGNIRDYDVDSTKNIDYHNRNFYDTSNRDQGIYENRDYFNRNRDSDRDVYGRDDVNRVGVNTDFTTDHGDVNKVGVVSDFNTDRRFGNKFGLGNDFSTDRYNLNKDHVYGRYQRSINTDDDVNSDVGYLGLIIYGGGGDIGKYGDVGDVRNTDYFRNIFGGRGYLYNNDVDRDTYGRYGGDRDYYGRSNLYTGDKYNDRNIYGRGYLNNYGGNYGKNYGNWDTYGRRNLDVVGRDNRFSYDRRGIDNYGYGKLYNEGYDQYNDNIGLDSDKYGDDYRRNLYFGLHQGYDRNVQTK